MSVFLRRILIVAMSIVMMTSFSNEVFAEQGDTSKFIDLYSQNDILFYNPAECEDGESDGDKVCVAPTGDQITWIGDSLTALDNWGAGGSTVFEEMFPGVDYGETFNGCSVNDYVRSGKTISIDSDGPCKDGNNGMSGLSILESIKSQGKLRPYLVFELGANNGDGGWAKSSNVKKMMELAGDNTQVVVLTSYTENNDYKEGNEALKKAGEEYNNLTVLDWASEIKNHLEYFQGNNHDGIHYNSEGYKAFMQFIKDNMPKNCSAGLLPGDNREEKLWNWFVKADFPGVSDNPAAIAGILGNFFGEQNYFLLNYNCVNGACGRGLHANLDTTGGLELKKKVDEALGRDAWKDYSSLMDFNINNYPTSLSADKEEAKDGLTVAEADKLIDVELKYITSDARFSGSGDGWPADASFLGNVDKVGDKNSPEAYSDLFLVTVEGAINGSDPLEDSRSIEIAKKYNWGTNYQGAAGRRKNARVVYDRLASAGMAPSGSGTGFSDGETFSSAGNIKYDASDSEIKQLLKFALWEEGENENDDNYKKILSVILDDFEKNNNNDKGKAKKLIKYVKEEKAFKYRADYDKYAKSSKDIEVKSEYFEEAKKVINDGVRITSTGKALITNGKDSNKSYCPNGSKGKGAEKIAETAALMAWPVQSWQTNADDYKTERVGKCYNDFDADQKNSWISYEYDVTCINTPRNLYREALESEGRLDCGMFSLSVLRYLELIDDDFFWGGQPNAGDNFRKHPDEWQEVTVNSESDLKPGDVLWNDGHIMIYISEKYGGDFGIVAHASVGNYDAPKVCGSCQLPGHGGRVGHVSGYSDLSKYTAFRYIGNKLGSGDSEVSEDGLTYEQAVTFMKHYGANKNNSSESVVPSLWDNCNGGGSNCVTFSAFFLNKFTDTTYAGGNGNELVGNLRGVSTGNKPEIWSVFSVTPNHTGVILGYHNGKWIVGHASCSNQGKGEGSGVPTTPGWLISDGSGIVMENEDINRAMVEYGNQKFAYPKVDLDKISNYLETGV